MIFALVPAALIATSISEGEDSETVRVATLPVSLVSRPVWVYDHTYTLWIAVLQRPFVFGAVWELHKTFIIHIEFSKDWLRWIEKLLQFLRILFLIIKVENLNRLP